jgi:hypothetical protein
VHTLLFFSLLKLEISDLWNQNVEISMFAQGHFFFQITDEFVSYLDNFHNERLRMLFFALTPCLPCKKKVEIF